VLKIADNLDNHAWKITVSRVPRVLQQRAVRVVDIHFLIFDFVKTNTLG
jgi:hypothetical protein